MSWLTLAPVERATVAMAPVTMSIKSGGRGEGVNITLKGEAKDHLKAKDGDRFRIAVGDGDDEGTIFVAPDPKGLFIGRVKKGGTITIKLPVLDCLFLEDMPRTICDWRIEGTGIVLDIPKDAWVDDTDAPKAAPARERPGVRVAQASDGPGEDYKRRRKEAEMRGQSEALGRAAGGKGGA